MKSVQPTRTSISNKRTLLLRRKKIFIPDTQINCLQVFCSFNIVFWFAFMMIYDVVEGPIKYENCEKALREPRVHDSLGQT